MNRQDAKNAKKNQIEEPSDRLDSLAREPVRPSRPTLFLGPGFGVSLLALLALLAVDP